MRKVFRIILWSVLAITILLVGAASVFIYKIKHGFPVFYETEKPAISFPSNKPAILIFSKTSGFRHAGSIEASLKVFDQLANKNSWFIYKTESGGVFNADQLAKFDAVIFNNSTGEVINNDQKRALEGYVENGGSLIGIHGAGDNSHAWPWYIKNLLGSEFSHHAISAELQKTDIYTEVVADSLLTDQLPKKWTNSDEWYVFFENPSKHGFNILSQIDGESINPDGNILFIKDKNFGMGKNHPVAWYKSTGKGKSFYTSMGHDKSAWENQNFVKLVENALKWAVKP